MYIKLTKIDRDAEISGYDAIEVTGKKLDDGKSWSKSFFANNDDLVNALDDFGIGEDVNVVMQKKGKFWNIKDFVPMEDGDYEQVGKSGSSGRKKSTASGGRKSSTGDSSDLTKEEWAEIRRVKSMAIAKAVAVKAAVEAGKKTKASIEKFADELLPYLLDTSPLGGTGDGKDPLDADVD